MFAHGQPRPIVSRLILPPWVYSHLSPHARMLIQQAELIAAVGVYRTLPHLLEGEATIHFVDNTGVLSNLIHGYASRPDCGRLVNTFHLTLADQKESIENFLGAVRKTATGAVDIALVHVTASGTVVQKTETRKVEQCHTCWRGKCCEDISVSPFPP